MAKKPNPRGWGKSLERATRALAANKARLNAADSSGLASDKTLSRRGYDSSPDGDGPKVPRQIASSAAKRRKRRRRR